MPQLQSIYSFKTVEKASLLNNTAESELQLPDMIDF